MCGYALSYLSVQITVPASFACVRAGRPAGLAGAASWALVPSTAPCPNPSASVTQLGLSTDGTSPARVIAAGGPAPSAALGPASAAVSASFPAGAVSFAQYREQTAYACVAPGT